MEPAYTGNGSLTYKIQRSTDNSTWEDIATTTGLSYTDTVATSSLFYYRVASYDSSDASQASPSYTSSVSITPKGTFDAAPSLSSDPTVTGITTKRATITWSTSRTSDSKISYGTSSGDYYDEEPSNSDQVTSHSIALTNLDPGTTYYYVARWTDEDGNTGVSDEESFTTDAAPTVKDPKIYSLGINIVSIQFTVEGASQALIYFGESTSFGGTHSVSTSSAEATYTATLTGLADGTKYYYKINTTDSEGDEYEGTILDFTTLPMPRVTDLKIQQVKGTAQPAVLVSWFSNTELSSILTLYPVGNPAFSRDEVNVALVKGEHQMIIRNLLPQTKYSVQISGRDVAGNEPEALLSSFTTASDTRPPLIANLKIEGTTENSRNTETPQAELVVTWDTDEPATSQVEFGEGSGTVYTQSTQEDSNLTYNHLVVISGLSPSKVYHLRAVSKDDAANTSTSVDTVTITPKAVDNALDLVINNLQEAFGFLGGIK